MVINQYCTAHGNPVPLHRTFSGAKVQNKIQNADDMSRILVLVGSVRRGGNTDLLARAFAKGAQEHHDVDIVSVADYKVCPCIGCNSCFGRADHTCFQKDDMAEIYRKLRHTDVLVIASPVYFYGISAQLKAVIYRLHTPLRNSFPIRRLALLLVRGVKDIGDIQATDALEQACRLGQSIK